MEHIAIFSHLLSYNIWGFRALISLIILNSYYDVRISKNVINTKDLGATALVHSVACECACVKATPK